MMRHLRPALVMAVLTMLLTGAVYPLTVTAIARIAFPGRAEGSLLEAGGRVVGSSLIGQAFDGDSYFHPRPSAAGTGYDASASGGSNLGPTSRTLDDLVRARVAGVRRREGLAADASVPVDLVTASASGLDPHVSPAAALLQVPRVARSRGMSEERVRRLVDEHTEGRQLGVLGERRVNVLELNVALDEADG